MKKDDGGVRRERTGPGERGGKGNSVREMSTETVILQEEVDAALRNKVTTLEAHWAVMGPIIDEIKSIAERHDGTEKYGIPTFNSSHNFDLRRNILNLSGVSNRRDSSNRLDPNGISSYVDILIYLRTLQKNGQEHTDNLIDFNKEHELIYSAADTSVGLKTKDENKQGVYEYSDRIRNTEESKININVLGEESEVFQNSSLVEPSEFTDIIQGTGLIVNEFNNPSHKDCSDVHGHLCDLRKDTSDGIVVSSKKHPVDEGRIDYLKIERVFGTMLSRLNVGDTTLDRALNVLNCFRVYDPVRREEGSASGSRLRMLETLSGHERDVEALMALYRRTGVSARGEPDYPVNTFTSLQQLLLANVLDTVETINGYVRELGQGS